MADNQADNRADNRADNQADNQADDRAGTSRYTRSRIFASAPISSRAPRQAHSRASARPMPEAAPVMTTTLLCRVFMVARASGRVGSSI